MQTIHYSENIATLPLHVSPAYLVLEAHQALNKGDSVTAKSNLQRALSLCKQHGETCLELLNPEVVSRLMNWYSAYSTEKLKSVVRNDMNTYEIPIKIYTLGKFSIEIEGERLQFRRKVPKRPLELLKVLLALGGTDVRMEKLADTLWPDAEGDAALGNLKTTVIRLRKLLGYKEALTFIDGRISLNSEYCWVDYLSFERLLTQADTDLMYPQLEQAVNFYQGDFLCEESDNYCLLPTREKLRGKYIDALSCLGRYYEKQKKWSLAIDVYQKGLQVDNLAEIFYQGLMRSYFAEGQHVEAAKTYKQCFDILHSKLSISPSDKTIEIYSSMKN